MSIDNSLKVPIDFYVESKSLFVNGNSLKKVLEKFLNWIYSLNKNLKSYNKLEVTNTTDAYNVKFFKVCCII
jgi:hypothetical protein